MENQFVRHNFSELLIHDRHLFGSRSLHTKFTDLIEKDFVSMGIEHRPTAEQYIENFYKSRGSKALLKRMKELSIIASHEMLRVRDTENTEDRQTWWDNKDTFQALLLDLTQMSPEARRAFSSVMKTNDDYVRHEWVAEGQRHVRNFMTVDNITGYEGAGSDIRDTMFETMFRRLDDTMRQFTRIYTV
jgi:hypothetical protein